MRKAARIIIVILTWPLLMTPLFAVAQNNYPSSPIRLVVAFPPGASQTDVIARVLAQKLAVQMNIGVVVDNKGGANGNIGAELVARSNPDGRTLLVNTASLVLSPAFGDKPGYNVFRDLEPVALVATSPFVLVAHPSVPFNNLTEFIQLLRANPGKFAYGSAGTGSTNHLGILLVLQNHGLSALHVPYKGSLAMQDLAAGRIQFGMHNLKSVLPFVRDKRLKPLAITSLKRSPQLPELPSLAEFSPGFEYGNWYGMVVPKKTPPPVVKRLNSEIVKAVQDPEVVTQLGADPVGSTPEQYGAYLKSEFERFSKVIRNANIVVDE